MNNAGDVNPIFNLQIVDLRIVVDKLIEVIKDCKGVLE